jgi:hypothetical protein
MATFLAGGWRPVGLAVRDGWPALEPSAMIMEWGEHCQAAAVASASPMVSRCAPRRAAVS